MLTATVGALLFAMEHSAKITVEVTQDNAVVATKRFKNPPRTAAEIKEALKEAGFVGELRDSDGDTLFGGDHLTRGQTYILHVVPGMLLYCVLALPERTDHASFCF